MLMSIWGLPCLFEKEDVEEKDCVIAKKEFHTNGIFLVQP